MPPRAFISKRRLATGDRWLVSSPRIPLHQSSQNPASQKRDIDKAFEHHALCVPLFISPERFQKLEQRGLLTVTNRKDRVCELSATPEGTGTTYRFTLVKLMAPPPGFDLT